ncbi:MAG: glycosyltransferase [Clostridia bacterium]|nr:glycosyltransferase [Clostridia bacterium]
MVIGQFCDTYPPTVDGVGRVTLSYCRTLAELGHEAYYIAPQSKDGTEVYGIPVILSASLPVPGELFRMGVPGLDAKFQKAIREVPFDLVHAQDPFLAGMEASRIARKRDIPLVSTFHSKYYDDALAKTHSRALADVVVQKLVKFYDRCDGVWTVNHATADVLRGYGFRGKILIMENGTDPEKLSEEAALRLSERVRVKSGVPFLLFVGQHNYKKNLHGILKACAMMKNNGKPFQLVTAGDGPDFDDIVKEAKRLGIQDDVQFLGFMSDRNELMALYHRADLLVFPSLYDNAPMVVREAAVMGTPALVVQGSCSAEGMEDQVNGYISPNETPEAIYETIVRALPSVREVGERARVSIPKSWRSIMEKVVSEYERLIDGHVSRGDSIWEELWK